MPQSKLAVKVRASAPLELLLATLGGCTGIDIVDIMRKQRENVEDLEIVVSGKRAKEPPRVYTRIHVTYRITGKDIKEKKVQRAIELSEDKYCSVRTMLRARADMTSNYVIE